MRKIMLLCLLILCLLFVACSNKTDYLQETINVTEQLLKDNNFDYISVSIESHGSEDRQVGKTVLADRDLVVEIDAQGDVSEQYAEICKIIQYVENRPYIERDKKSEIRYSIYTRVRCNGIVYMLDKGFSLLEVNNNFNYVYNVVSAKNGENWTEEEIDRICEDIEDRFEKGSYNAVLNGDTTFEYRTWEHYSEYYNISISKLKSIYDEWEYDKYH